MRVKWFFALSRDSFDYTSPENAEEQKDILFSSKHITLGTTCPEYNRVLLYHALTGVKFKIGSLAETDNSHIRISSIQSVELTNIYSTGSCTISPDYEGASFSTSNADGGASKSSVVSKWNDFDNPTSFSVSFDDDEQNVDLTTAYSYPTSFTSKNASKHNLNDAQATKTFMLIPQALTDDTKLTITYTYQVKNSSGVWEDRGENTATVDFGTKLTAKLPEGKSVYEWLAGELHTYSITVGDNLDVTVTDEVKSSETVHTKSNLQITNTGTSAAYIRVAVVGNWFYTKPENEDPNIPSAITPCDNLIDYINGVLKDYTTSPLYNTDDWTYVDGYYYYKYLVPAGRTISEKHALFDTLSLDEGNFYTNEKPYNLSHLEIVIPVQAVREDQVADAWGSDIITSATLSNTVKY